MDVEFGQDEPERGLFEDAGLVFAAPLFEIPDGAAEGLLHLVIRGPDAVFFKCRGR